MTPDVSYTLETLPTGDIEARCWRGGENPITVMIEAATMKEDGCRAIGEAITILYHFAKPDPDLDIA